MYGSEGANNNMNKVYFYFTFQDISSTGFTIGGYIKDSDGTCQYGTISVKEGDSPTFLDENGAWEGSIVIKHYNYESTKEQATIEFIVQNGESGNFASQSNC